MIQYISKPFKWFLKLEAASGIVLLFAAAIALIISNSNLSTYYEDILNAYFDIAKFLEKPRPWLVSFLIIFILFSYFFSISLV